MAIGSLAALPAGGVSSGAPPEVLRHDTLRAFPAAQGWAARTPGGRGGRILRVTTLAASGPGSLREAVETRGPRIVVFEVGGVVDLDGQVLTVEEPFLTVAGQTAPSPGITLIRGGVSIRTHDVVVQHLRVRPGSAGRAPRSGWEVDGLSTSAGARDVIVDHSSFSWATDENLSTSGPRFDGASPEAWRAATSRRITFSNNIVAEGLSNSTHAKGEHSKGTLLHDNVTDVLVVGNLYASNVQRNPLFKGGAMGAVVNNLIYNPGNRAVDYHLTAEQWAGHPYVTGRMALVGNVLRYGPDTRPGTPLLWYEGAGDLELYAADNHASDRAGGPVDLLRVAPGTAGALRHTSRPPTWPEGLQAMPAAEVAEHVLRNAGARPWDRDAVDERIVRGVREGTGRIIDGEAEVGGYPPAVGATRRPFNPAEWDLRTMTRRAAARGGDAAVRGAYAAVVDARHAGGEGARVNGVPTYRAIGGALDAAPAGGTERHTIFVRNGRYREKLTVDRPNIGLVGESRTGTVLTYDAAAGHPAPGGGTWGTRGSFTLRVAAPGFRLENMTVENAFDYPVNAAKPAGDPTRVRDAQAVAVLLDRGSDRALFRDCVISGYQDTLFADAGRAYFSGCTILGHVDFIFGAGQAVFHGSDIVSRDRGSASNNGYISAPSTLLSRPYGFLFLDCRLLKESPAMAPGSVVLGRPWHPSGNPQAVGSAVFVNCFMDDHIGARGWTRMSGTNAAGERRWFQPEDARFFEYGSTGPGAIASPTRRVLTDDEAVYHTITQVLRGWDPRALP